MDTLANFIVVLLCIAIGVMIGWWFNRRQSQSIQTQVYSSIEELKAIGQLNVFKAVTKEIITETDHTFGEFGRKYLKWVFSHKKLAMVFEFEVNFSYNLQDPEFKITTDTSKPALRKASIEMPPCEYQVGIRNLQFYDEQRAALLPWLLPSLIGEAFGGGFDEVDKNRLIKSAQERAQKQAEELIAQLKPEVEQSAKNTLSALAHSFDVHALDITFKRKDSAIPLPEMLNTPLILTTEHKATA
jgi:hypothetical protein